MLSKSIQEFAKEFICNYDEEYDDEKIFENCNTEEEKIKRIQESILNSFEKLEGNMKLGDWNVSSAYGSNESEDLFSQFLYDGCDWLNQETIKIMWGDR